MIRLLARRVGRLPVAPSGQKVVEYVFDPSHYAPKIPYCDVSMKKRSKDQKEIERKLDEFSKETLTGFYHGSSSEEYLQNLRKQKTTPQKPVDSASSSSSKKNFSAKAMNIQHFAQEDDDTNDVTSSKFGTIQDRLAHLRPLHETTKKKRDPILPRIKTKVLETFTNTKKYVTALFTFDGQYLQIRTAAFLKNNYRRIKKGGGFVWHELCKLGRSLKLFKDDVKFSIRNTRSQDKYGVTDITVRKKMQQVQRDVYKFVPFSIFIIIPGLELLLPAWLVIFPNAIPSQFKSPKAQQQEYYSVLKRRLQAAEKLIKVIPNHLEKLQRDKQILKADRKELEKILNFFKEDGSLPTDLLQFKKTFRQYLAFKHWETKNLLRFSHYMGLTPVTGLNIINNLLGKLKLYIPVDSFAVRWFTKPLLTRELRMYFRKLRREDIIISYQNLEAMEEEQIDFLCMERGIQVLGRKQEQKIKNLKVWLSISNLNNVPDSLLLMAMIVDFAEDSFETTEQQKDYETVRRSESDIYFKEKFKAFEKAFGIEMLRELEEKITQRQRDLFMGKFRKNVIEENEIETVFKILDDFKRRHSLLSEKIEDTYEQGYKFLDMLEKQLILEMVLSGRGEELEQKSPDLARKGKKFLGEKFYAAGGDEIDWETEGKILQEKLENLNDNYMAFKHKKLINFREVARRGSIPKTLVEMRDDPLKMKASEPALQNKQKN